MNAVLEFNSKTLNIELGLKFQSVPNTKLSYEFRNVMECDVLVIRNAFMVLLLTF